MLKTPRDRMPCASLWNWASKQSPPNDRLDLDDVAANGPLVPSSAQS